MGVLGPHQEEPPSLSSEAIDCTKGIFEIEQLLLQVYDVQEHGPPVDHQFATV